MSKNSDPEKTPIPDSSHRTLEPSAPAEEYTAGPSASLAPPPYSPQIYGYQGEGQHYQSPGQQNYQPAGQPKYQPPGQPHVQYSGQPQYHSPEQPVQSQPRSIAHYSSNQVAPAPYPDQYEQTGQSNVPYGWRSDLQGQGHPVAYARNTQNQEPPPDYNSAVNSLTSELSARKTTLLNMKNKLLQLQNELGRAGGQTKVYEGTIRQTNEINPHGNNISTNPVFQSYEREMTNFVHQVQVTRDVLKQNFDERYVAGTADKKVKYEYEGCCGCCCSGPGVIYVNDLCNRKPKLHFTGCCNTQKVNVDICPSEYQHIDWIWGRQNVVVEGMFSKPSIKLNGLCLNPRIHVEGIDVDPIINITGICVEPLIEVEGIGVHPTINVVGICHRPNIRTEGMGCTLTFNVTGVCVRPVIKSEGCSKVKLRVDGTFHL